MRLDPPGFTGPSASNDRYPSSGLLPFYFLPRHALPRTVAGISFSRNRPLVLFVREQPATGTGAAYSSSWPNDRQFRNHRFGSTVRCCPRDIERDEEEGPETTTTRNATASRVCYHSVYQRDGARPTLGNIFEENDDRRVQDGGDDDRRSLPGEESTGAAGRSCRIANRKPRTRWKTNDRDGSIFEGSLDLSRIPATNNATDVPSVDAFPYTAYNDENDYVNESCRDIGDDSCAVSSYEIGNETRREETNFSREVRGKRTDDLETNQVLGVREKGERPRKFRGSRNRDSSSTDTKRRETLRRVESGNGGKRECHYTARFQKPITNESFEHESELSTNGPTKLSSTCGRKYGLLFILYLLAWPLVCSTNPSGQFVSSFTHNPSLGPVENLSQHNNPKISPLSSSSSSSSSSSTSSSSTSSSSSSMERQRVQYQQQQQRQQEKRQSIRDIEYGRESNEQQHRRRHEERQEDRGREQREVEPVFDSEATHPYNEYSWEVNQINPWLSACDLAGPAPADLQGSCGPPEVPKNCPVPCVITSRRDDAQFLEVIEQLEANERNCYWSIEDEEKAEESGRVDRGKTDGVRMAPEQCLFYLEESHKRDICRDDFGRTSTRSFLTPRENRYWFMSRLRLRHCCEHAVVNALAPGKGGPLENVLNGGQKCADALDKLLLVDALAARLHCEFEEVLARYDCAQPYSVIFNCTHCKEAYRKWVCSSLVPYFAHGGPQDLNSSNSWAGSRLRPCRSFCQSVEQRCPYLLPGDRAPSYPTQYAGEPTFLCRDPNIPETGEQAARALHSSGDDECCFHACSDQLPGLGICANCTDREPRRRGRTTDPPTAPRCEINPIQPASTGEEYQESRSTDKNGPDQGERYDLSTVTNMVRHQGTLLCGTGIGVGSIASVSSSDRSTASVFPQLFWLCSILTSVLGNVRKIPILWVSKIFLWFVVPLGGNGAGNDRAKSKKTDQLIDLVVRLRRCFGRVSYVGIRYGAKWLLEKWMVLERRCRSWWCCCWYWWWWRWRVRENRPCRFLASLSIPHRTRRPMIVGPASTIFAATIATASASATAIATIAVAIVVVVVVVDGPFFHSPKIHRYSFHTRSIANVHAQPWKRSFPVDPFVAECSWPRWSWWWWWLYRWWYSWKTRYDGPIGYRRRRRRRRGRRRRRRRMKEKRGWSARRKNASNVFKEDVWSSLARQRYLKLSSRKDPP
ncbi:unnamed protein product [Xylocopa violacea]|uniref:Transmembrane protein n=1 Tax=Xylocopa violacea TaxID=135666 RepID=A0ABP1NRN5_XYLVO